MKKRNSGSAVKPSWRQIERKWRAYHLGHRFLQELKISKNEIPWLVQKTTWLSKASKSKKTYEG